MYSPSSVWRVQEVIMSVCGVEGYSSVMRWMVVGVACAGRDLENWQFC